MSRAIVMLLVTIPLIFLCGCSGGTESYVEDVVETESIAPQRVSEAVSSRTSVDPDRRVVQPQPEQMELEEPAAQEREVSSGERESQVSERGTSLSQIRQELDTAMAQLKTAIFEERDPFKAQSIVAKLEDIFQIVGPADSSDPKLNNTILKVMEHFAEVSGYIQGQHISGAQHHFIEMEKHYQEWKARMK